MPFSSWLGTRAHQLNSRAPTGWATAMPAFAKLQYAEPSAAQSRSRPDPATSKPRPLGSQSGTTNAGSAVAASPAVNLVVATPCFGGQISVHYAASLLRLQALMRK